MDTELREIQLIQIKQLLLDMPACVPGLARLSDSLSFVTDGFSVLLDLDSGKLKVRAKSAGFSEDNPEGLSHIKEHMVGLISDYHDKERATVLERARRSRNWKEG